MQVFSKNTIMNKVYALCLRVNTEVRKLHSVGSPVVDVTNHASARLPS